MEQPGILKHHAEHTAQILPVEIPDIVPIHTDGPAVDVIEPHEQLDHGSLAGARRADDGNFLPGPHLGAEILDNDFIRIIAKTDVIEFHAAIQAFGRNRVCHGLFLFLFVEKFEYPFRCRRCGLEHVGDLRHLLHRLGKIADILDKGLDIAHRDGPVDGQSTA